MAPVKHVCTVWFDGCPDDSIIAAPADRWHTLIFVVAPEDYMQRLCAALLASDQAIQDAADAFGGGGLSKWSPANGYSRVTHIKRKREAMRGAIRARWLAVLGQHKAQVHAWSFRDRCVNAVWPHLCEAVRIKPYNILAVPHGPTRSKVLIKGHHDWPRLAPNQFAFVLMMADIIMTMDQSLQYAFTKGSERLDRWDMVTDYLSGDGHQRAEMRSLLLRILNRIHPDRFAIFTRGLNDHTDPMIFADVSAGLLAAALDGVDDPAWSDWWTGMEASSGSGPLIWKIVGPDFRADRVTREILAQKTPPAANAAGGGRMTAGQPRDMSCDTGSREPLAPSVGPGSGLGNPAVP